MKRLTQIFQALLGVVALIFTAIIAFGRLAWRTIRNWWKKRSKGLRRSVVAALALFAVGYAAFEAYDYYDYNYGRDYYDRRLSDDIVLYSFADNRWRVYDCQTEKYVTDKINWLSEVQEGDSLAVYALPDKRGYINVNTGRIVIDAKANDYRKAWVFSEGLAAVMKEGKIGFINANNEVVIPFQFDYTDKCRMWDFGYIFHNGYCAMPNADGDLGLIDKNGKWVVEPAYDEVWAPHTSGYRVIVDDGKYGILDADGAILYPAVYRYISIGLDGFVLTKGGKQWQVDFEGNTIQPFMFDDLYYLYYPVGYDDAEDVDEVEDGVYELSDYAKYEIMNRYGIMNRITGELVTLAVYSDVDMISEELFKVQKFDLYEWHVIDKHGNNVE